MLSSGSLIFALMNSTNTLKWCENYYINFTEKISLVQEAH